jgi:hypothetical protein
VHLVQSQGFPTTCSSQSLVLHTTEPLSVRNGAHSRNDKELASAPVAEMVSGMCDCCVED